MLSITCRRLGRLALAVFLATAPVMHVFVAGPAHGDAVASATTDAGHADAQLLCGHHGKDVFCTMVCCHGIVVASEALLPLALGPERPARPGRLLAFPRVRPSARSPPSLAHLAA